jgi:hypothetical protein
MAMADFHPCVRVVQFSKDQYTPADRSGPPLFTWRDYYRFRNDLLSVLERYGSIGRMGATPILENWETSKDAWHGGADNPDFFVVADMWNQYDRWCRVEASPWLVNETLVYDLILMLATWPNWCIYLALTRGALTVLGDSVLYEGELFAGATTVKELGQRCALSKNE